LSYPVVQIWRREDEKPRSGGFAETTLKKKNGARFRCPSLSVETHAMGRGATVPMRMIEVTIGR
jgi:hypothetical protein